MINISPGQTTDYILILLGRILLPIIAWVCLYYSILPQNIYCIHFLALNQYTTHTPWKNIILVNTSTPQNKVWIIRHCIIALHPYISELIFDTPLHWRTVYEFLALNHITTYNNIIRVESRIVIILHHGSVCLYGYYSPKFQQMIHIMII